MASDCQSQSRSRKFFPAEIAMKSQFYRCFRSRSDFFELRLQSVAICDSKSLRFGSLSLGHYAENDLRSPSFESKRATLDLTAASKRHACSALSFRSSRTCRSGQEVGPKSSRGYRITWSGKSCPNHIRVHCPWRPPHGPHPLPCGSAWLPSLRLQHSYF